MLKAWLRDLHVHWQNLNDGYSLDRPEKKLPYRGRAWLHLERVAAARLEWNLWSNICTIDLQIADNDDVACLSIGLPPVFISVGLDSFQLAQRLRERFKLQHSGREISLTIHDWTLWWRFWQLCDEHDSATPRWLDGSFKLLDTLLGKVRFDKRILREETVRIPLPERSYAAKASLVEILHHRPRAPTRRWVTVSFDMEPNEQIPIPGKGENSWDCGEDASFGFSCPAKSIDEAIGLYVANTLRTRRERGGSQWKPASHETSTAPA